MNILSALKSFDLSENEAKVYTTVLSLGLTNVGPIVEKSKLHRQSVYVALEKLKDIGLMSEVTKNNRKHFEASSPQKIVRQMEEKCRKAKEILPTLLKLEAEAKEKFETRVLYGKNEFFENLKEISESAARTDKVMRILGGARDTDFYKFLGKNYKSYIALLKKLGVVKYAIGPSDYTDEFKIKFIHEEGNKLKTMDVGLTTPTYTRITPEMVSVEIYGPDVTIIQMKNKVIAKSYCEHFNLLWEQAVPFSCT
ncbi:MAG: hypothetical protein COV59_00110 [Candidatus Magasanikbacteria bacterium CG11_big_fil_rev_8_21_14_0_20_39_34]|uniref:Transcription regulator TrmB N-terminal domain-containing protein n=1 Tax=Candidatus Magasanikbacteria bacterium CG11_big_fil_rev_8_21_14_0_20_39_34 TaxID=1974653 RepID=A0A2H0N6K7_9BACT|nr:MAG: hypothetical protein COV59_00110 [Candidatus Magasanikbacteria bacterium CG11_big_fil_rev_8_21_14_0_20_39_34]